MKKDFNTILNILRTIRLTEEEKSTARASISLFMEALPRTASTEPDFRGIAKKSPYFQFGKFAYAKSISSALVIMLLIGGSVSYAAQTALPGQLLYPVKINFNEQIQGIVHISEADKASWEAERASNRLAELTALAAQATIDSAAQAEAENDFKQQTKSANQKIIALQGKDVKAAAQVSSTFASSLKSKQKVLAKIVVDNKPEVQNQLDSVVENVTAQVNFLASNQNQAAKTGAAGISSASVLSIQDSDMADIKAVLANAKKVTIQAGELYDSNQGHLKKEMQGKTLADIKSAEALIAQGNYKLDSGEYVLAEAYFDKAFKVGFGAKVDIQTAIGQTPDTLENWQTASSTNAVSAEGSTTASFSAPEVTPASSTAATTTTEAVGAQQSMPVKTVTPSFYSKIKTLIGE